MSHVIADATLTVEALMAQAYAMEREASARYREFAEIMENCNNGEVAALFHSIAAQEAGHAEDIRARMGWSRVPVVPARHGPALAELESAHYLMQPWHVLQIAIEAERRAHDFFASIALACEDPELRAAATHLQDEEREHLALLDSWLARVPVPVPGWDEDPDPPRYTD